MWILCGRNVGLGAFTSRDAAVASVQRTWPESLLCHDSEHFMRWATADDFVTAVRLTNALPMRESCQLV